MTEWSKLLHQLNSISPSLKDPVKRVHISGHHCPVPTRAAREPKAAQPAGDRWQHPRLSSAPAASPLWSWLIGNTLVYTEGVDGERRRRRGQRQRHNQTRRKMEITSALDPTEQRRQLRLWQKSVTAITKGGFIVEHISAKAETRQIKR